MSNGVVAPDISVIVMAYRNETTIEKAVESVLAQAVSAKIEIIIVTSGPGRCAEIVRERWSDITVVDSEERFFPGAARNAGVRAARGRIIAFLAADCVCEPGWVEHRLKAHAHGARAVASSVTNAGPFNAAGWGSYYAHFCSRQPGRASEWVEYPGAAVHGLSFERALLDSTGPFREDLRTAEDTDMAKRISALGERIWFENAVRTGHHGPPGTVAMLKDHFMRGGRRALAEIESSAVRPRLARQASTWGGVLGFVDRCPHVLKEAWRHCVSGRGRLLRVMPWMVAATASYQVGLVRYLRRHRDELPVPENDIVDGRIAFFLTLGASFLYALTFQPDWMWDNIRYADYMQSGDVTRLLAPLHALANLLPLALFSGLQAIGIRPDALVVGGVVSLTAGAAAVGLSFLAARALGAGRAASAVMAAVLTVTMGFWRAGSSAGVYGVSVGTIAVLWLLGAHYVRSPRLRGAARLGAASGVATATHLFLAPFGAAAIMLVWFYGGVHDARKRWRALGIFAASAAVAAGLSFFVTAGVATGWDLALMPGWLFRSFIGPADPTLDIGWGLRGFFKAIVSPASAGLYSLPRSLGWLPTFVFLAGVGLLLLWAGRAFSMLQRRGLGALAAALLLHAVVTVGLASWYDFRRADYFNLALIPIALLVVVGARGVEVKGAQKDFFARLQIVGAGLVIAALGIWNLTAGVLPSRARSLKREAAVQVIAERAAPGSLVIVSPSLAPGAGYAGFRGETGWGALVYSARPNPPRLDLSPITSAGTQVFVSSKAFGLTPSQERYLGATNEEIMARLRKCCGLEPVASFEADDGREILYRLGRSKDSGASSASTNSRLFEAAPTASG